MCLSGWPATRCRAHSSSLTNCPAMRPGKYCGESWYERTEHGHTTRRPRITPGSSAPTTRREPELRPDGGGRHPLRSHVANPPRSGTPSRKNPHHRPASAPEGTTGITGRLGEPVRTTTGGQLARGRLRSRAAPAERLDGERPGLAGRLDQRPREA